MKKLVGRASVPAAFGGTDFQPVRRTGKMPVPAKTFQTSKQITYPTFPRRISPFPVLLKTRSREMPPNPVSKDGCHAR
jgi:hypothetical protein